VKYFTGLSLTLVVAAYPVRAQISLVPDDRSFWIAAVASIGGATLVDMSARRFSIEHRSHGLDRAAEIGDGLGSGKYLIGAMATSWAIARLTGHREVARHVLHVAAAYTVGNIVVSALKPAVGRERPLGTDDAWRFRPLSTSDDWHAFPSGHAIHAFTLAAAVASESHSNVVAAAGYSAAALVGWSRVYSLKHWPSDVSAAAVLGIVSAKTTLSWLHR